MCLTRLLGPGTGINVGNRESGIGHGRSRCQSARNTVFKDSDPLIREGNREPQSDRQLGMRAPMRESGQIEAVRGAGDAPSSASRARLRIAALVLIAIYAVARLRNPEYWDPLDDLNLAVHEAGH